MPRLWPMMSLPRSLQDLIAIGIAVGCLAWLVRTALARLARPGCGDPGKPQNDAFVSSESLARSRPQRRE